MEIKISTRQLLNVMHIVSWILFIGLCVEAGGILFNTIYTFAINPINTKSFWEGANLSDLYNKDQVNFIVIALFMLIPAVLKAILFYLIVKLLSNKKLDFSQPFNTALHRFMINIAYLAFGIGLFSYWGVEYRNWLAGQQIKMPDVQQLNLEGADVWLFMSVILVVIVQIFKRGMELQSENELTI